MAIDEAIVQAIEPDDPPVLRFFDWSQPAISIGYSQKINEVLDVPICKKEKMFFVRRPTGGGVVLHGGNITYSVIIPVPHREWNKGMFWMIQYWIKKGMDALGIETTQYNEIKKNSPGYCFVSPSFGDIIIADRKIGGLAGRRIRQKMLYQGYLYFENADKTLRFVKGIKELDEKAVNLKDFCADKVEIKKSIVDNWYEELTKDKLNDKEEDMADSLCESKYSQDEWNLMR